MINTALDAAFPWRGREDSNPQPSDPKSDALSSWATPAGREKIGRILQIVISRVFLNGASEGNWTLDHWNHNPELYQLSYARHAINTKGLRYMHKVEKSIPPHFRPHSITHSHKSFTINLAFTHSYVHYDFLKNSLASPLSNPHKFFTVRHPPSKIPTFL